jgi:hypothetical protein
MHLTGLDLLLWAASFAVHLGLLFVLLIRRRAPVFPMFTTLIITNVGRTIALFLIQVYGTRAEYFYTFWSLAVLDVALQLCVVYEMASHVFRPSGSWPAGIGGRIWWWLGGSVAIAAGLTWIPKPSTHFWMQLLILKGGFFSAALLSELFVGMIFLSATAGLPWKTHVARIAQGLGVYSVITVFTETGNTYFGLKSNTKIYDDLSHLRIAVYIGCVIYWIIMLWREAPRSPQMTDLMRQQLDALDGSAALNLKSLRSRERS